MEGFSKGLSAYRGVNWDKATGKWRAQALAQGKKIALGRFFTQDQAAWAYDRFQVKQQGRWAACPNIKQQQTACGCQLLRCWDTDAGQPADLKQSHLLRRACAAAPGAPRRSTSP